MGDHGTVGIHSLSGPDSTLAAAPTSGQPAGQVRPSRHLFGPAAPAERFLHGLMEDTGGDLDAVARKLWPLVRLLARSSKGAESYRLNEALPAGYTYLAQLMVHDLTEHSAPLEDVVTDALSRRDHRTAQLVLDSIYGGGPNVSPMLYETAYEPGHERSGRRPVTRMYLRLGRLRRSDADRNAQLPPARDLPRQGCPFVHEAPAIARTLGCAFAGGLSDGPLRGAPDVLIADQRNDDNAVLSQLVVFFHLFHNWVVDALAGRLPVGADPSANNYARFLLARRIVAHCFRRVVRDDLMKRLLKPRVYEAYCRHDNLYGLPRATPGVSLEFAHGIGRVAHGMVAPRYKFAGDRPFDSIAVLSQNSRRRPRDMPFTREWIAPWANFFEIEGFPRPVNLSRRIQPSYNEYLASLGMFNTELARAGITTGGSLMMFDFLRSAQGGLHSIRSLRRAIGSAAFAEGDLYFDATGDAAAGRIAGWLRALAAAAPEGEGLNDDDIAWIAADPPLSFYAGFEAMEEEDGCRLGVIGSVIFAETVFPALAKADALTATIRLGGREFPLAELAAELVPESAQADMGRLIAHVAREAGLENADPGFLA